MILGVHHFKDINDRFGHGAGDQVLREVSHPLVNQSRSFTTGSVIDGGDVRVTMTLTEEGWPLHAVMVDWVREAVRAVPGVERVDVRLTFDPPWTPARVITAAR